MKYVLDDKLDPSPLTISLACMTWLGEEEMLSHQPGHYPFYQQVYKYHWKLIMVLHDQVNLSLLEERHFLQFGIGPLTS